MACNPHDSISETSYSSDVIKTTLGLLPLVAISAALASPALAQSSAPASSAPASTNVAAGDTIPLGVINVQGAGEGYLTRAASSDKLTAPLLDTPQTVSVIPQTVIREQGARNLTEVLRNTPGISFDAGENGFATSTNNFKIRGFDSSGSVFIDGARDAGSYARDTFNIDRVEVFKGAAADNGRGGAGGYVNMVTKAPTLGTFVRGEVGTSFDGFGTRPLNRATIDANHAVTDTIAIRLNAMGETGGVMGRDIAESKAWGIAPSVTFGLGTDFRATLSYEHLTRRDLPDWGVPGATIPGLVTFDPVAGMARRDAFYGLKSDFDNVQADALSMRLEYDINSDVTISNQTRWSRVDRTARYTLPTGYIPASRMASTQVQIYDRETTTLTNLTNVTARVLTGGVQHTISAGVDLTSEKSDANRYGTANGGNTSVFWPNPWRSAPTPLNPTERANVTVDTAAVYLYDTIKLNEQWQITGGLRGEYYNVNINDSTGSQNYTDNYSALNGKIGIVYKPVENASIYASYSVASQPPGSFLSNPDISRTGDNAFPGFVPGAKLSRAYNYEAGVKWDFFGGKLSTTTAVFHTERRDVPITGRDVGDRVDSLKGYGKQTVQGVEFNATGNITEAWAILGGFAFMHSERKHNGYLDGVRRRANPADYDSYLITSGDALAFTPKFTANLWTTYDINHRIRVGAGFQYVGESWLGRPDDALRIIPNGRYGKLPSYMVVNVMTTVKLMEGVDLRFNIDNLFGEAYAVTTNWNGSRATLGAPRVFRVSSNFRF